MVIKTEFALCTILLHFTVEHNHTHHKHWARPRDPTSSPWGRNVYFHFLRTIPLQVKGAYRARPKDVKYSFIVEAMLLLALLLISPAVLAIFIVQAVVAVFLLEFVNYLQHHGLIEAKMNVQMRVMHGKVATVGLGGLY